MPRLTELRLDRHLSLLPAGMEAGAARARLAALLARTTGPETAGLFAAVSEKAGLRAFDAPEGAVARLDDLDETGQAMLRAEIGRVLSELRRAATLAAEVDPARDGDLPALVAAAREVPGLDCIFAHEGRPVLAGWGLAPITHPRGLGLLAALDDGRPPERAAPSHLKLLAASAAALVVLGAVAAVAMPVVAPKFLPDATCQIAPGQLDRLGELHRAQAEEAALRNRIAEALRLVGQRRVGCPVAQALPAERWDRGDLAMLEGCWNLDSSLALVHTRTGEPIPVRSWRMCFDRQGAGTQVMVFGDGTTCSGDAQASFDRPRLMIDTLRNTPCDRNIHVVRSLAACERVGEDRASCRSWDHGTPPPPPGQGAPFTLRR